MSSERGSRGLTRGGRGMEWAARVAVVVRAREADRRGDCDGDGDACWREDRRRTVVRGCRRRRMGAAREVVLDAMLC